MTTQLMERALKDSISELLAKIQKDHPYIHHDLEMSRYKSELTDDESNLYMAYQIMDIRKELEIGNDKAFKELTREIDNGPYKWVRSWMRDFKHIEEVINHLNLILEFFRSRSWYSDEYERLASYRKDVLNAYLNVKQEKKDFKSKYSAYE